MYIMLKTLDNVYMFTCMTLNSKAIKKKYYRDGYCSILKI